MSRNFSTEYHQILDAIDQIDPVKYGYTRNHIDGAVTYLSPYIARGVINTRMVLEKMIEKGYRLGQMETFVKELCWRDYFQRVAQAKNINTDIRQEQSMVTNRAIPVAVVNANTGINAIDKAIRDLYASGYMHNHCRMYTAFLTCNLAQSHWLQPARWMYHHLLDGDWASNACSWQWVAGTKNGKKYYANQENINKYTGSNQTGTYLNKSYEELYPAEIPAALTEYATLNLSTNLPTTNFEDWHADWPTFIYNYYNLDPLWHKNENGNRVLLLDPNVFSDYPVSDKCISFILELSKNIPGIQIFTGSFEELKQQHPAGDYYFKEHPLNSGYQGKEEPRDWIAPDVNGYYPSFFAYWKKAEKSILKWMEN